jgi:hypothetical protein
MGKKLLLAIVVLATVAGMCHGEVAVGVSAAYPLAFSLIYEEGGFDYALAGAAFRWKPSLFLIDAGGSVMLGWPVSYWFLDFGICFDLAFLRFALVGGVDFLRFSEAGAKAYIAGGFNAKINLDVRLGKLTVGVSATIPLDLLAEALGEEGPADSPRILAAQPSVNVMYWFGRPTGSRLR